jgi:uroporphyrinogen decarboxylase
MTKREIIKTVLDGGEPPYVPWNFSFTQEARAKLEKHYEKDEIERSVNNHFVGLGNPIGFFEDIGNNRFQDIFGVIWDRSIDKDIGNVEKPVLQEPALTSYEFPDPLDQRVFNDIST